jgi:hypothetical protein
MRVATGVMHCPPKQLKQGKTNLDFAIFNRAANVVLRLFLVADDRNRPPLFLTLRTGNALNASGTLRL